MSEEMQEIRLTVGFISGVMGESDNTKEISFTGREIASRTSYHGETSNGNDRGTTLTLYETKKGKYLLYTEDWSNWQNESTTRKHEVFDTLEDLEEQVPDGLIYETKKALGLDPADVLDI